MKVAVIGTGISGLAISQMLKQKHEVTVFEKSEKIGGLIKCERVNDCLFHKVGGHVFNSKNEQVANWFWSHFDKEKDFFKVRRNAKIFFRDQVIGYPFENYLYLLNQQLVKEILNELIDLERNQKLSPFEYDNFESFLRNNFGQTLYELYFQPYNLKLWQTDLSKVSMHWLEGKLPMPNLKDIVISNVIRQEENEMVHSTFYYPVEGGSQFLVDRLSKGLFIQKGISITDTVKDDGTFTINSETGFDRIIYCGSIRALPNSWTQLLVENGVDVDYLSKLRSNGTSNLFCETDETDISWLYIPEAFTKAHRIIYTGNFSPTNNRGAKRKTCVVEFSGKVEYELMVEEIKKLPGNLEPIAHNYEPDSYVVQDQRTRKEIALAKRVLEEHGIFLLGRFAEWEYYNMDKCIESAFIIAAKLGVTPIVQ